MMTIAKKYLANPEKNFSNPEKVANSEKLESDENLKKIPDIFPSPQTH